MNDKATGGVHWSFWVVGAIALVWHVMGSLNYLMQTNADFVATLPETHRAIINGRPVWATGGFAMAVFGGALGSLLLLLRKSVAIYLFVAALLGVVLTMIHTARIASSVIDFSAVEIIVMVLLPFVVAAALIWYSSWAKSKGWIS